MTNHLSDYVQHESPTTHTFCETLENSLDRNACDTHYTLGTHASYDSVHKVVRDL